MLGYSLLLVSLLGITRVAGHDWALGACPSVKPVDNLAVDKFLGLWYVIEQFDTSSLCLTMVRWPLSQYIRVRWPLNLAGKGDYIVFDTDYTHYAGIYECQAVTSLMHRKSASILSREPTLSPDYVDRVKRRLTSFGIDLRHLDRISHEGCRSKADADVNLHVDGDTLTNVMSGARDGIEDAANTFINGIRGIATTVSNVTQNTFNNFPGITTSTFGNTVTNTPSTGFGGSSTTTTSPATTKSVDVNIRTGSTVPDEDVNSVLTEDNLEENFYSVANSSITPSEDEIYRVVRTE
ncbi:uncharacterized protein LOC108677745 [Hyalella azteca]|uniref:Uncharacterized protein LOC108677745 n=1 Tax=Hyalella azteca TaxID=294128 RepID=A0A979FWQ8_HYAAZ|nr:uncharacterized protein LOC108677745 [Hyalella azteca]